MPDESKHLHKRNIGFANEDLERINRIQTHFGLKHGVEAVRLSLKLTMDRLEAQK